MIEEKRLQQLCQAYDLCLDEDMLHKLSRYAQLLTEWNQKINLTTITAPQDIEVKHFLDCLLLGKQQEIAGTVVDVGTGAGFPGLVLKIYRPEIQLTLIEPTTKRVKFLECVAAELNLDVEIVRQRAEEAARKAWREQFDVAVARAVAAMPVLCEYCLPLVRTGGSFIAMKADAGEELAQAADAIQLLGGQQGWQKQYTLPGQQHRTLIQVKKLRPTPPQYPRNGGAIAKRPLGQAGGAKPKG